MTHYSVNTLPPCIENWKNAIEGGLPPQEIAQTYHAQALLKGTVSGKTVQSHKAIEEYFILFTAGKHDAAVIFHSLHTSPSGAYSGEYTFTWTDDNGAAQSAEANYTFEPVQNNDMGEIISLHHSSFLPVES